MLKHVAFWAFVFLPFSTGILPIRYSTTNFCHSLWFLKCNFRPLFPHWRNWKKMLHRRDPRWNYGHWKLQGITFFTLLLQGISKNFMIFFAIGPALWPKDQWVCTFKSWDWNARWNQRSWWQNNSVKGEKNFQESKIYDFDLNFLRFTAVKANSLLLPTPLASMSSACTGSLHYMQRFCRN